MPLGWTYTFYRLLYLYPRSGVLLGRYKGIRATYFWIRELAIVGESERWFWVGVSNSRKAWGLASELCCVCVSVCLQLHPHTRFPHMPLCSPLPLARCYWVSAKCPVPRAEDWRSSSSWVPGRYWVDSDKLLFTTSFCRWPCPLCLKSHFWNWHVYKTGWCCQIRGTWWEWHSLTPPPGLGDLLLRMGGPTHVQIPL